MNAKMPELKRSFEAAGFTEVKTVLSSGNVVFSARSGSERAIERRAEKAMNEALGRAFLTLVRSLEALSKMLEIDPFADFRLPPDAKRIVTFLREPPPAKLSLPIELNGARILRVTGREAYSVYRPNPRGPVFMTLIEKTFGEEVTTRTWETVRKVVNAR